MHTSSNLISTETKVNPLNFTAFPAVQNLNTNKSYVPYSGCVVDHILGNTQFSNLEKLKYLLADSLSLINHNTGKQRAVSLPATKWAKMLNCSKAQVFELQKSLEGKGYLIVERTKNKLGKNKRNLLIPTLPDQVFTELSKAPIRWNADCTGYTNTVEAKRAYLDRTKLFIPLNYQLLKLIIADHNLTSFAKVIFIDFLTLLHKCHINAKNNIYSQNNSSTPDDNFDHDLSKNSLVISYSQLIKRFNCDKRDISKVMIELEKLAFITRKQFFVKNNDEDDNLHDKSLWRISLILPPALLAELIKGPTRAKSAIDCPTNKQLNTLTKNTDSLSENTPQKPKLNNQVANTDPYVLKSSQFYNKDFILNIKDLDTIDANLNLYENLNKSTPTVKPISELSVSYKNLIQEKEVKASTLQQTNNTEPVSINNSAPKDNLKGKNAKVTKVDEPTITSAKKPTDQNKLANTVKFSPNATLKDWYPVLPQDVDRLNSKAGREFSNNFVNELLLKLHRKYPDRIFPTKNHMLSYLAKALNRELHQSPLVNHETFRFAQNDPESIAQRQKEKYLMEVEYSSNISYEAQLRRKIAALFESKLAYQLLTQAKFTTTVQEQRSGNNQLDDEFDEQCLKPESETMTQEANALSDDVLNKQQTDTIQNSQNHSFTVKLNQDISLSDFQQKTLENAITAVYGHVNITYQQLQSYHRKSGTLQKRLLGEICLEELDPNSAWYKIRLQLREQFGHDIDKSWFSKLTAQENLQTNTLTLLAPSNFMRDWIKNKYGHLIEQYSRESEYSIVEWIYKDIVSHVA